ncbi:MAG: metallophosphoesterase [Geodermatophilaceae bacterium]
MHDVAVSVIAGLSFLGLVIVVLGVMNYYIWRRAVRATTLAGSRWRRIGTWLLVVAVLSTVLAQASGFVFSPDVARPLAWVGFSWLGFAFYLLLFLLLGELVRLAVWILDRRATTPSAVPAAEGALVVRTEERPSGTTGPGHPGAYDRTDLPDRMSDPDPTNDPDRRDPPDLTNGSGGPGERPPGDSREVTRRLFLSRSIAAGAAVAAAGVGGYGMTRALMDPVVRRVGVQIAGLDPALAGFRITMFADAHLGSIRRRPVMERIVDLVNGTEPDLVAVVGDLIDGSVAELADDVEPMSRLQSPQGTFFVTGNHEYYSGAQDWINYLPDVGVRVLRNERLAIERSGASFDLAGVNDITGEDYDDSPDYEKALGGRNVDRPVVLLCHQPVSIDRAVEFGVDLQLSGHTHGGQMWPFHYVVGLQQGSASGLSRVGDTQLYVDSGVGLWGPPMRVGADPEITVIELQPAGIN